MAISRRDKERKEAKKTSAREWAKQQEKGSTSTALKLPEGTEQYKLEPGVHLVDFMPYIAGKGNPRADEGFQHFEREYTIHWVPGPDGKSKPYCCSWECFHKPCLFCKRINSGQLDADLAKAMRGKSQHLWIVNDKIGDIKNPLKVFSSNHYNRGMGFGEMMADAIVSVKKYADFTELEGGLTLQLTVKEQTFPGGKYNAVTRIDFLPRDYDYPEDMLDKAPCLDDCLVETSAAEQKKILDQENGEPEEEASNGRAVSREAPVRRRPAAAEEDNGDDAVLSTELTAADLGIAAGNTVTYQKKTCEVVKVSADGTSLLLKDESGRKYPAVDPAAVVKVEADETEDSLPKGAKKLGGSTGKKASSTTDDDDDDPDEEGAPPAAKGKPFAKPTKKAPPPEEEDEDDPDDDDSEDDDDEEDE